MITAPVAECVVKCGCCFSLGLVNGWIVDCGGGTLCKATSPLRDARPNDAIFEGLLDW